MSNAPQKMQWIELTVDGEIATVTMSADATASIGVIRELGNELYALVEQSGHTKIVLDCSKVAHMPSSALNKVMVLHKKVSAANGQLVLCGLTPAVSEVFEITKLHKMLNIQIDRRAARQCILDLHAQ